MDRAGGIEKAISFAWITACQAVNTHCFMCLPAKTEQLSPLLGSHGTRPHASAGGGGGGGGGGGQEEVGGGSANDLPESVIHYCQVHSLLKRGIIGGGRSKSSISKQLLLAVWGIYVDVLRLWLKEQGY